MKGTYVGHPAYDAVGNATTFDSNPNLPYNNSNELTTDAAGNTYTYDNNGNRATLTYPCSGSFCGQLDLTTGYAWDFENRLSQVTMATNGNIITFKYDPFGRRIQKSVTYGQFALSPVSTTYAYDGANVIEEIDTNSGSVTASYTQGAGIDEPLAMQRDGSTYYYDADGLGSITSLTDSTGALVNTYSYPAFGSGSGDDGEISLDGPPTLSVANPYQFTGREYDSETGLYYYRARYYDPSVGRFLSEDPVAFGASVNFYPYVRNTPTMMGDPSGLFPTVTVPPGVPCVTAPCPFTPTAAQVDAVISSLETGATKLATGIGTSVLVVGYLFAPGTGGYANSIDAQMEAQMRADEAVIRTIPKPPCPKRGCTCTCRADADDTQPGNIKPGLPLFAFGTATAPSCSDAAVEAKRLATHALKMKPKHIPCKCTEH